MAAARHGIGMPPRGALVAAGRARSVSRLPSPEIRFGIAQWPYDLLLRFAYDLPEHEHVWPNDWFDDGFEQAAIELRQLGPKLVAALAAMQPPLEELKNAAMGVEDAELTREQVTSVPLHIDLVLDYLARMLDCAATVIPHCYGQEGKALASGRGNLRALAGMPLAEFDPELAGIVAPDGSLPAAVSRLASPSLGAEVELGERPTAHSADIYAIVHAPGFEQALPKAAARALRQSAEATIAAADAIDATLPGLFGWFDRLLEYLIGLVCERAEEGEELGERWSESNWTVIQRLSFADTDAALALTRALPAIAEGPLLPGTEDE